MNLGVQMQAVPAKYSSVAKAVAEIPDFCNIRKDGREEYASTTLIHEDIKWMNVLVQGKNGQ